jgi:hypothetical protein
MGPFVTSLWIDEKYNPPDDSQPAVPLSEAELNTIGYVVSRYGRWTGRELEIQTHGETPWQRANEGRLPRTRKPIRLSWIAEYFREAEAADREDDDRRLPRTPRRVGEARRAHPHRAVRQTSVPLPRPT